jgi:hypothetical protein
VTLCYICFDLTNIRTCRLLVTPPNTKFRKNVVSGSRIVYVITNALYDGRVRCDAVSFGTYVSSQKTVKFGTAILTVKVKELVEWLPFACQAKEVVDTNTRELLAADLHDDNRYCEVAFSFRLNPCAEQNGRGHVPQRDRHWNNLAALGI